MFVVYNPDDRFGGVALEGGDVSVADVATFSPDLTANATELGFPVRYFWGHFFLFLVSPLLPIPASCGVNPFV